MATTKLDPFALVGTTLFNDLSRLFDGPGATGVTGSGTAPGVVETWKPRVDVAESDTSFLIRAELPGIDPDSIDVTVEQEVLSITGTRSFETATYEEEATDEEEADSGMTYRRREILEGTFVRKIRLHAEVDVDAVIATSSNGILEITVPKQPVELPRKVTVAVQR
jgi:HSP20 family protein